ncbi:MAG: Nitrilase/cyanide hydratase and apolipoprotein N-acyltransferase [Firmicutes bacterium]|nr:Nitrilase/cyanide hydratase and apolipoprotein N-acyltransferase [Bacillota bacterium]
MQVAEISKNAKNNYLGWVNCSSLLHCILTIALSALSFYLSTEYWCFAWIALLLLCIYALRRSLVLTFLVGFFSCLFGSANPHAVLPIIIYWPLIILNAGAVASVLVIFHYIGNKWENWSASLVFASGLTAQEFIFSLCSPHGTVSSIAYTQVSNLPIIQIASITGIWGITFLMALTTANIALFYRYFQNRSVKINLLPISLLIVAILFGFYRLNMPFEGEKIKIGIASISINLEQYLAVATKRDKQQVDDMIKRYIHKVDLLAQSGAEVVLLPEKIISVESRDNSFQRLSDTARKNKVNLIVGVTRKDNTKTYNSAYVFSPVGEVLLEYDKKHLQTTFESRYTSGSELGVMGNWGVGICKDMDFTQPALDYSKKRVNIVFVPALDFHDDSWSHARVAIMRGIEGNYAVARAGQWGLLTLSDSRGRIIEQVSCDVVQEEAILVGEVSLGQGESIYSKLGNSFGWMCLGIFIILSILLSFMKPMTNLNEDL